MLDPEHKVKLIPAKIFSCAFFEHRLRYCYASFDHPMAHNVGSLGQL
jgi:hypothetical protein